MRQLQHTILQSIGRALRVDGDAITRAPLPRRWVDLIHHLDEQERKRSQDQRPEAERTLPKPAREE